MNVVQEDAVRLVKQVEADAALVMVFSPGRVRWGCHGRDEQTCRAIEELMQEILDAVANGDLLIPRQLYGFKVSVISDREEGEAP